jgi:predicted XRE-type DNA-binding protein
MVSSLKKEKAKTSYVELVLKKASDNLFADFGFGNESEDLLLRGRLMGQIREIIRERHWTQAQAASYLDISQPRVAEIMQLKVRSYRADRLLYILNQLGYRVNLSFERL